MVPQTRLPGNRSPRCEGRQAGKHSVLAPNLALVEHQRATETGVMYTCERCGSEAEAVWSLETEVVYRTNTR